MINLFKGNEGFNYSTFEGLIVNDVEQIPDEIKNDLIQVDEETYQKLVNHELMWQNGELVSNPNYQEYVALQEQKKQRVLNRKRIKELKQLLAETDYRAIKYAEGLYTDEEFAPYKKQRQEWRDEINRLEVELGGNQ